MVWRGCRRCGARFWDKDKLGNELVRVYVFHQIKIEKTACRAGEKINTGKSERRQSAEEIRGRRYFGKRNTPGVRAFWGERVS